MTNRIFEELIGEKLSSVTFVVDYLQLSFDGPTISVYNPITIKNGNIATRFRDDEFKNQICLLIAKVVKQVTLSEKESLSVFFEDDSQIHISLKESDYTGPEAISCSGFKNGAMLVA